MSFLSPVRFEFAGLPAIFHSDFAGHSDRPDPKAIKVTTKKSSHSLLSQVIREGEGECARGECAKGVCFWGGVCRGKALNTARND
jgi:hypothetical protein